MECRYLFGWWWWWWWCGNFWESECQHLFRCATWQHRPILLTIHLPSTSGADLRQHLPLLIIARAPRLHANARHGLLVTSLEITHETSSTWRRDSVELWNHSQCCTHATLYIAQGYLALCHHITFPCLSPSSEMQTQQARLVRLDRVGRIQCPMVAPNTRSEHFLVFAAYRVLSICLSERKAGQLTP